MRPPSRRASGGLPGGATGAIVDGLKRAGYRSVDTPHRFVVKGKYGPLRDGELERARQWGSALARALGQDADGAAAARSLG